jgi:mannose-6-phosphate isomerase-like protein (cupin superfamily)
MRGPGAIGPGGGEIIGDSADRRVEILSEDDSLHATWSRFGPGRDGADLHVHRHHSDLFYVIDGELTVKLGPDGDEVAVAAGSVARVPPLVVHGFRNASDADVRYLNFHVPGSGFADYMRGLRDKRRVAFDQQEPPADGGRPPSEAEIGDGADVDAIRVVELRESTPAHVHRHAVESLYVLDGAIDVTVRDRELRAEAGTWVQVPPGFEHAVRADGRYLRIHTPNEGPA